MEYGRIEVKAMFNISGEFTRSEVDTLADAMISAGMAVKPVIVIETWIDGEMKFDVIGNQLTARAAQQANELYPREWEMVQAFIINPKDTVNVSAVLKQLEM